MRWIPRSADSKAPPKCQLLLPTLTKRLGARNPRGKNELCSFELTLNPDRDTEMVTGSGRNRGSARPQRQVTSAPAPSARCKEYSDSRRARGWSGAAGVAATGRGRRAAEGRGPRV